MGAGASRMNAAWFTNVFGVREIHGTNGWKETRDLFRYDAATGALVALAPVEREFVAGFFSTPSLEQLRQGIDLDTVAGALGRQPLTVREIVADVATLHTKVENRYAVFQAASQFNALEHTSQRGVPEDGITCYAGDHTQGPACAVACAPGTVVRNYFAFDGQGQTRLRQVRNLGDAEDLLDNETNGYFKVINGYTMANEADLHRLSEALHDEGLREAVRRKLRIGVQQDTEVVCSDFGSVMYQGRRREQLVTQAYCSAISVSYSCCSKASWEAFARLVLESLYEATMYVAANNYMRHPNEAGARRVFLTSVGGGVFGNSMNWIRDAMVRALTKFEHVGFEVILVSFGRPTQEFSELEERWGA
eukprot:TRINITY_DN36888_c0_g1_i1.p1 TRINITY_DN36888_c0_g1~~TRINITY_DN36888_c0_g1_i1.p1  ORF type:complete len:363 (+),score=53.15 TRINITY_DN36888_c0_g1_i1:60-1148(+)